MALYFASQGAGKLLWPLLAGMLRLVIAVGGGWIALRLTGSLGWVFVALSAALVTYGVLVFAAVASGVWFRSACPSGAEPAKVARTKLREASS